VKAYQVGGQAMQQQLNTLIFDACFVKGEDISRDSFLADVAVKVGLMNRERVRSPPYPIRFPQMPSRQSSFSSPQKL